MKFQRLYFNAISPLYSIFRRDAQEVAFVTEWLAPPDGAVILDAGAGPGHHSLALASKYPGAKVIALDFAAGFRHGGRRRALRAGANIDFVNGDVQSLPFPDRSVDASLCLLVLWAVPNRRAALSELARVLKPGSPLIVGEFVGDESERPTRLPFGNPYTSTAELLAELSLHFENPSTYRRGRVTYVKATRKD